MINTERFKKYLIDRNLITEKDLAKVESLALKNKKDLEDFLISENFISEDEILKLKAYILGVPYIDLVKEKIDAKILAYIPESIARQ